jgi:hypothetical protein
MKKKHAFFLIKEILFGRVREPVDTISTGFHTVYPRERMPFQQWLKQHRVSMLYDRKRIEINH